MIQNRITYLYLKGSGTKELIEFLKVYDELNIRKRSDQLLEVVSDFETPSEIIQNAREFCLVELYQDFTVFVSPPQFEGPLNDILTILPQLNPKIYTITSLIQELVVMGKWDLIKKLKNYYYSQFNSETIETILGFIDQNLNATKTAKALFMHRNTLNYRLDNFIQKTEIDVRSFFGALSFHMMFRR
ncbi:MAG: helix-turn-helix domain-containing protein [Bacilli bacterium]|nr:helix-turn-helix domain-containing protein [Bacilli bacterium]MBN2877609.1 helix-turn-helix domain-containing protein [Bacilli bacterium]